MCVSTQAKGTCEDYNPVLPEGSMSSFNHSSPGPTPLAELEDQPVTRGEFREKQTVKASHLSHNGGAMSEASGNTSD